MAAEGESKRQSGKVELTDAPGRKLNAMVIESAQEDGDGLTKGFQRKVREAEERHLKEFERIGLSHETSAHAYEGGSFGDSKNATVAVGKISDGTIYAHIIDAGLRDIALGEVLQAVDNDAAFEVLEKYSIQYAFFDPNDRVFGSISPVEGTPGFDYHNARGDLEPTSRTWADGGRIYRVKNVSRDELINLYGLVTAFHKYAGNGSGLDPTHWPCS